MWRVSALILVAFVASCAGTPEAEPVAQEELAAQREHEEALREIEESETERTQVNARLEGLKEKIRQTEQELAAEKARIEEAEAQKESIQDKLSALQKEQKEADELLGATQKEPSSEQSARYFQDAEFVVHGLVDTFGTGMDGSLVRIGFHIREVLKGNYAGAKVEFEALSPEAGGGVKAFDLFKKHGHDYIICFKKGAQEGKYEYCGPRIDSPEIIANNANLTKVKEVYLKAPPAEPKK